MAASSTSLRFDPERVGEPARALEFQHRGEALGLGRHGTLLPRIGRIIPSGGVEQPEAGGAGRVGRREGKGHASSHRGAGDDGGAPADMIEQVRKIVGELFDPVGALRLVGLPVAAAIIHQNRGRIRQRRRHRVPERVIHRQRMDEDDRRCGCCPATHRVGEPRAVAHLHMGQCHANVPLRAEFRCLTAHHLRRWSYGRSHASYTHRAWANNPPTLPTGAIRHPEAG